MAAKSAIGMMRNDALERIEAALPGFEMPRQGNDAMLLHAKQLQAIAEFLECQQAGARVVEPTTYERLEAFAAAVNVEDAPIKEVEDFSAFVESVNQPIKQPAKPAPKAKRK